MEMTDAARGDARQPDPFEETLVEAAKLCREIGPPLDDARGLRLIAGILAARSDEQHRVAVGALVGKLFALARDQEDGARFAPPTAPMTLYGLVTRPPRKGPGKVQRHVQGALDDIFFLAYSPDFPSAARALQAASRCPDKPKGITRNAAEKRLLVAERLLGKRWPRGKSGHRRSSTP